MSQGPQPYVALPGPLGLVLMRNPRPALQMHLRELRERIDAIGSLDVVVTPRALPPTVAGEIETLAAHAAAVAYNSRLAERLLSAMQVIERQIDSVRHDLEPIGTITSMSDEGITVV